MHKIIQRLFLCPTARGGYGIADSGVNKAFGLVVAAAELGFLCDGLVERIILSGELVPAVA